MSVASAVARQPGWDTRVNQGETPVCRGGCNPVKELTQQQKEFYLMLRAHIARHGFPPTRLEICKHFGFNSPTKAAGLLEAHERRGYIELAPGTPRGIRLVEPSNVKGLPIIGSVALGQPILSEAGIERLIDIDPMLFAPYADYFIRMVGGSMRGSGIVDRDLLAVHVTKVSVLKSAL